MADQPLARQSLVGDPVQPELQVPLTPEVSDRVAVKVALPVVVSRRQMFSVEKGKEKGRSGRRWKGEGWLMGNSRVQGVP